MTRLQRLEGIEGDDLMRSYATELSQYQTVTKKVISTFKYLDRFFIRKAEEHWCSDNKNSLEVKNAMKDRSVYFQRILKATMPPWLASERDNRVAGEIREKEEESHSASSGESSGSENGASVDGSEIAPLEAPVVNMPWTSTIGVEPPPAGGSPRRRQQSDR